MSNQLTRQPKVDRRRDRRDEQRKREEERRRAFWLTLFITIGCIVAIVLVVGITIYFATRGNAATATTPVSPQYPSVDSVSCESQEQLAYHIHAHLSIYINGAKVDLPQGVGIATDNSCIYWLHTHDTTGVIHMESPTNRTFTLGNFLNLWNHQFSTLGYPTELAAPDGWQVYVDGKAVSGDFRNIVLKSHELITLAFQSPSIHPDSPGSYSWPSDLPQ